MRNLIFAFRGEIEWLLTFAMVNHGCAASMDSPGLNKKQPRETGEFGDIFATKMAFLNAPEQNAAESGAGANHHAAGSTAATRGCHRHSSRRSHTHTQTHATIAIGPACRERR